jgi:hypothetical protein
MRRIALFGSTMAAFLLGVAQPASAQTSVAPPVLTGEIFAISQPHVRANCDPSGTSTITFRTSGVAVGPYPGTYMESGTVTLGPQTGAAGFVNGYPTGLITSVNVNFAVNSPIGQVSGTKSLPAQTVSDFGICQSSLPGTFYEVCSCASTLAYTATIDAGGATYQDQGVAGLILDQVQGVVPVPNDGVIQNTNIFMESFASSLQQLIPLLCDENAQGDQSQDGNNQGCSNQQ